MFYGSGDEKKEKVTVEVRPPDCRRPHRECIISRRVPTPKPQPLAWNSFASVHPRSRSSKMLARMRGEARWTGKERITSRLTKSMIWRRDVALGFWNLQATWTWADGGMAREIVEDENQYCSLRPQALRRKLRFTRPSSGCPWSLF